MLSLVQRRWSSWLLPSCPHCRSLDFRSVGVRNPLEAALYFLLRPFRCGLCGRHFFLLRWLAPSDQAPV